MDVNNTYFHLLLGRRDWTPVLEPRDALSLPKKAPPASPDVVWDEDCRCVSLRPLLFRFPLDEKQLVQTSPARLVDRRDAAQDRYGHWYSIDDAGIDFLPEGRREAQRFWPVDDPCAAPPDEQTGVFRPAVAPEPTAPLPLRGLALTTNHYLVVGVLEPAGLLIFDLHAGGSPIRVEWPLPFYPLEIAPRPGGGVWILDVPPRDAPDPAPRYWGLDRYFRVETCDQEDRTLTPFQPDDFQPKRGPLHVQPHRSFPGGLSLAMASPLEARLPMALEVLPDDSVLILETDPQGDGATLYRYEYGEQRGPAVSLEKILQEAFRDDDVAFDSFQAHDMAFVPQTHRNEEIKGTLYVVGADGNQAFAFRLEARVGELKLALRKQYFPMRRFGGKGLVTSGQAVYYDLGDRWLPLVAQPRPRHRPQGRFETSGFDGKEPDCVWHRLLLDACIPPGTEVRVESRAANDRTVLPSLPWQQEPNLYLRATGAEIPYYCPFTPDEQTREGTGTWELLFQRARGRYFQLRLSFLGTGRSTPRLFALRIYYPRFSYLNQYLPDVYQQDATSASFLERYLANVEGFFTDIEGRIAEVQTLFDVRTVDAEFLDWLASWLGVVLDPDFDERRRRLLLDHAIELFNQRGTLAGLVRTVRLAVDPCPDDTLFDDEAIACDVGRLRQCDAGTQGRRYGVRFVEQFLTRCLSGVYYGDPTDPEPVPTTTDAWTMQHGTDALHQRFRAFLKDRYGTRARLAQAWEVDAGEVSFDRLYLSPVLPARPAQRTDWRTFLSRNLAFPYADVTPVDVDVYRTLLARRYGRIETLNRVYGRAFTDFCEIDLPGERDFPAGGRRLFDWIQFVSLALPIHRNRHRFTALIPIEPGSDPALMARRLALVERLITLEKPAHTGFEVKPYWALFRVGSARLGLDTRLNEGSRYVALLLGYTALAEGFLAAPHPFDVTDRIVTGRDAPGPHTVL